MYDGEVVGGSTSRPPPACARHAPDRHHTSHLSREAKVVTTNNSFNHSAISNIIMSDNSDRKPDKQLERQIYERFSKIAREKVLSALDNEDKVDKIDALYSNPEFN